MKRSRNYPRLRHGGYLWRWMDNYWVWQPDPLVFMVLAWFLLLLATPLTAWAFALEMGGVTVATWILGWRLARPEDFE
jgi:hypothetical protein